MKTNLLTKNWTDEHTISPENSQPTYPISFMDFLLESQRNNFYPGKTHMQTHNLEDAPICELTWLLDEHGFFSLHWKAPTLSEEWMPVEIDSYMLTTQVQIA